MTRRQNRSLATTAVSAPAVHRRLEEAAVQGLTDLKRVEELERDGRHGDEEGVPPRARETGQVSA